MAGTRSLLEDEWDCPTNSVQHKKKEGNNRVCLFCWTQPDLDEVQGHILDKRSLPSIRKVVFEVRKEEIRCKVMLKKVEYSTGFQRDKVRWRNTKEALVQIL